MSEQKSDTYCAELGNNVYDSGGEGKTLTTASSELRAAEAADSVSGPTPEHKCPECFSVRVERPCAAYMCADCGHEWSAEHEEHLQRRRAVMPDYDEALREWLS